METLNLLDIAVAQSTSIRRLSSLLAEDNTFMLIQGLASDSAALALEAGQVPLAVSLLEQGRSIIFTQLGRYRSVIDDIREVSRELADRFSGISAQMNELLLEDRGLASDSLTLPEIFENNATRCASQGRNLCDAD